MKNIRIFSFLCVLFITIELYAQDTVSTSPVIDKISLGIGMGMDYGGFGGNLTIFPSNNVGVFAGLGYAFAGAGYNVGVKLRSVPKTTQKKYSAFGLLMYGYNAAVAVMDASQYNKFFYGPTIGIGVDYRSDSKTKGYWSAAFFVPVRSSDVSDYIDDLKSNHGVEFKTGLIPIAFSIGYRFNLN